VKHDTTDNSRPICAKLRLLAVDGELGGRLLGNFGHSHSEHPVLEAGAGVGQVCVVRKLDAALHLAVGALQRVVLVGLVLVGVLALGLHEQGGTLHVELQVLGADSGEVGQNLELRLGLENIAAEQRRLLIGQAGQDIISARIIDLPGVAEKWVSDERIRGASVGDEEGHLAGLYLVYLLQRTEFAG